MVDDDRNPRAVKGYSEPDAFQARAERTTGALLDEARDIIARLQADVESARGQRDQEHEARQALIETKEQYSSLIGSLQASLHNTEDQVKRLMVAIGDKNREYAELHDRVESLTAQLAETQNLLEVARQESGKWPVGPVHAAEEVAKARSTVVPAASLFHGALRVQSLMIDVVRLEDSLDRAANKRARDVMIDAAALILTTVEAIDTNRQPPNPSTVVPFKP